MSDEKTPETRPVAPVHAAAHRQATARLAQIEQAIGRLERQKAALLAEATRTEAALAKASERILVAAGVDPADHATWQLDASGRALSRRPDVTAPAPEATADAAPAEPARAHGRTPR